MTYIDIETLADRLPQASSSLNRKTQVSQRLESDEQKAAFKKIERLVKVRDRSVCETRKRLEQDGFASKDADAAIVRALSVGYLDDARFADVLVRSRLRAGKGIAGIVRELRSHAIDPYEVLWGFPDEYLSLVPSQEDAAFTLLCRKPPRAKNLKQAAYAKLIRSGYSSAVAAEATKRWYESREKPGQ